MTHDLGARLTQLEGGLEGLLSCFESERFPDPGSMDAAWAEVMRTFEEVRAGLESSAGTRAEHQEKLASCLRLYAVAAGVLVQRREELASERSLCSQAGRRLRHLKSESQGGGSCDVRG